MERTTRMLSAYTWAALVLVIVGALNWGMVGLLEYDLVAAIFGGMSALSRIIYVLVGVAGVYLAVASTQLRRRDRGAAALSTTSSPRT